MVLLLLGHGRKTFEISHHSYGTLRALHQSSIQECPVTSVTVKRIHLISPPYA